MFIRLCDKRHALIAEVEGSLQKPFPEVIVTDVRGGNRHFVYSSKMMLPGGIEVDYVTYIEVNPMLIAIGADDVNGTNLSKHEDLPALSGFLMRLSTVEGTDTL